MTVLRSYVSGAWIAPADDGRPVLDAVTGQEVARVSSAGIDLGAALAYGRSAGGPVWLLERLRRRPRRRATPRTRRRSRCRP